MPRKKMIEGTTAMQSIVNNMKSIPDERMDAAKMKAYLRGLRIRTGLSEQALILKMLFFAFNNSPEFDGVRGGIVRDWKNSANDK